MIIRSNPEPKFVHEYDFTFMGGTVLPITIDPEVDTIVGLSGADARVEIVLAPKPSLADPDKVLPAESITIHKTHLLAVQHRVREVQPLTPDQKFEWGQTVKEMSKLIN